MGVHKKGGLVGGFDQLRAPDAPTISVSAGFNAVTVTITNPSDVGGGSITGYAASALTGPIEDTTFAVTVVSSGGNKYAIDGSTQGTVTLHKGHTYIFDQSDSSNSGHPLRLSTTSNGTHGGGSEYTTGVTTSGTPGSAGAFTKIAVSSQAGSTVFDGTDDWLSISASNDFDISDGEVTYEGWVYFDNSVSNFQVKQCIWEHYTDDNNLARLFFEGGNGNVLRLTTRSGGTNLLNATGTTTIAADTWYHIAVTRSTSGDWETFINGTKDNGASGSESSALDTSGMTFYLGVDFWNVDRFLLGNLSNFRIVKGTRVYTSNFTVPTGPLTAITNTVLLTCTNPSGTITDLSSSNHSITVNSGAAASSTNPFSDTLYYYCSSHSGMGGTANLKTSLQGGASGSSSPITVSSLTNDEAYNIRASAINVFGQSPYSAATSSSPTPAIGIRFAGEGGGSSTYLNVIDKISIGSTGNATDFGDTSVARDRVSSGGNTTRGLVAGGRESSTSYVVTIEYITFASASDTTDFGDLTSARRKMASMTSSTRSIFAAGELQTYYGNTDTIDYVTTASTGNATDFGDTSEDRSQIAGFSSATRGVMGGGYGDTSESATAQDEIFYITMASTGNTTDFGDLLAANFALAGLADATRGVFGGGDAGGRTNVIQYVTIASTGNATDFGDLLAANSALTGNIASSTRGIFCGGNVSGYRQNVIQYITIQSTGNATDFGDLTTTAVDHAGTASSNASVQ